MTKTEDYSVLFFMCACELLLISMVVDYISSLGVAVRHGWGVLSYTHNYWSVEYLYTQMSSLMDEVVECGVATPLLEYANDIESLCEIFFC